MHLTIEPEDATSTSRRRIGGAARIHGGVISVDVAVPAQQRSHWCWAAITVGMERYYGRPARDQLAIARAVLGADTADDALDRDVRLDRALTVAGCYSHWSPGKPTLARLRFEINLGRPVAARIEWNGGGGHYVLVTGYDTRDTSDTPGDGLIIADPQRDTVGVSLATFPRSYDRGGTWTESFWTTPPVIPPLTPSLEI